MEYVDVLLNDNREYQKVVLLVDRPDFLSEIKVVRKKWGLDRPVSEFFTVTYTVTYEDWQKILVRRLDTKVGEQLHGIHTELYTFLAKKSYHKSSIKPPEKLIKKIVSLILKSDSFRFYWDIYDLKTKFLAPDNFIHVIGSAVACNKVTEKEFQDDTYYLLYELFKEELLYIAGNKILVAFDKDVTQSQAITAIKKIIPTNLSGRKKPRKTGTSFYDVAPRSSIRQMRDYYWESKETSPAAVAKKYSEYPDYKGIFKSIREYKKLLTRHLH